MSIRRRCAVGLVTVFLSVAPMAFGATILGTGDAALIGGDLTDPDNDINDDVGSNPPYFGTGYDFVSAFGSSEVYFSPGGPSGEAALDLFDNKLETFDEKWCCAGAPQDLAVEFSQAYVLTHFTVASAADVPDRDPDNWRIEGSNDGVSWTPIFSYDVPGVSPFSARLQVIRYDAGSDFPQPAAYRYFRYAVDSTVVEGEHQLGELELFGTVPNDIPALDARALALLAIVIGAIGAMILRRA